MKNFTIDADNNITVHSSRKAAKDSGATPFLTEEQFADAIGNDNKRLVEIWNSIPGVTPVKKFKDRKTATERIWKAIQGLGQPAAGEAQESEPEVTLHTETVIEEAPVAVAADQAAREQQQTVAPDAPQAPDVAQPETPAAQKATRTKKAPKTPNSATGTREGSKTAMVLDLMKRQGGVTSKELMEATGWQAHSLRGFISGTIGKKLGLTVISAKREDGTRFYSIGQ